jgi:mono/diheme cytochrome c family protein
MRGAALRRIVILLPLLLSEFGPALAQPESAAPEEGYVIEAPFLDVDPAESVLYREGVSAREVIEKFSKNPDQFTQTEGRKLYETSCQACHLSNGEGAAGAAGPASYPPLADNPRLVSKHFIVAVLLTGYHGMPRFGDQMDDEQIAAVANYVRGSFGNAFPGRVAAEDVRALRRSRSD